MNGLIEKRTILFIAADESYFELSTLSLLDELFAYGYELQSCSYQHRLFFERHKALSIECQERRHRKQAV